MNNSRHSLFTNLISTFFIFLFAYTASSKLLKLDFFIAVLAKSPLIGHTAEFTAWAIIASETVVVLLLLYSPSRLTGLWLSLLLMSAFTVYIGVMLISLSHLPCSCGGILNKLTWRQHFYLNFFLMLAAFTGLVMEKKTRRRPPITHLLQ